jgi:hypothetical protein
MGRSRYAVIVWSRPYFDRDDVVTNMPAGNERTYARGQRGRRPFMLHLYTALAERER